MRDVLFFVYLCELLLFSDANSLEFVPHGRMGLAPLPWIETEVQALDRDAHALLGHSDRALSRNSLRPARSSERDTRGTESLLLCVRALGASVKFQFVLHGTVEAFVQSSASEPFHGGLACEIPRSN